MITRRGILGVAGALGIAAVAGCSSEAGRRMTAPGGTQPPKYIPFSGVTPDLPGNPAVGIPPGYYRYPANPPKITSYPLPQTDPISFLTQGSASGVPLDRSDRWKALQADVGNELPVIFGGVDDEYTAKFQTSMAGSDTPSVVMMENVPELPKLLDAKFTELGEFIGGDRIKEYPGLATIPSTAWTVSTLNGRLWGVPQPRPPAGFIMSTRGDLLSKRGIDKNQSPADGAELLELMKEMTDPSTPQFAMGAEPNVYLMAIILEMLDAPNGWQEEGGEFTSAIETDQYREALTLCKSFWDAGVLHPNSFSEPGNNSTWWQGGLTQVYIQPFINWAYFTQRSPEYDMGLIEIPRWDGSGPATKHTSIPAFRGYAAISKQESPERVREILRVLDYFAAPYGTEEYLRFNYGPSNKYYNITDGVPIATDAILNEPTVLSYFGSQSLADLTGPRELVDIQSEYLQRVMPSAKRNATLGLYSDSASSKGAAFDRNAADMASSVIQGRSSLSEWDALVEEWQGSLGKEIKAEYRQAFEDGGGA